MKAQGESREWGGLPTALLHVDIERSSCCGLLSVCPPHCQLWG